MGKLRISPRKYVEGKITISASATGVSEAYSGFAITLLDEETGKYFRLDLDRKEAEYISQGFRRTLDATLDAYGRSR